MRKYAFGVDIGGTTIKLGLFQTDGLLLEKWEISTDRSEEGSHILEDIADSAEQKMKNRKIHIEEVTGIGVGVPGPVKPEGIAEGCVNLGWGTGRNRSSVFFE
ncbi:MAG: ROK family protein [Oliverpabstia sp.]